MISFGRILGIQRQPVPVVSTVEQAVNLLELAQDLLSQAIVEHQRHPEQLGTAINARRHVLRALHELGGAP